MTNYRYKAQFWGKLTKYWLINRFLELKKAWVVRDICGQSVYWYDFEHEEWFFVCEAHEQPQTVPSGCWTYKKIAEKFSEEQNNQ